MNDFWNNALVPAWNYILHLLNEAVSRLTPIAWPVLVLFVVVLFRKQLAGLLGNLKRAQGFGVEIVTGDVTEAKLTDEFRNDVGPYMPGSQVLPGQPGASIKVDSIYAENHYFFGHDLMLCYCALITGAEASVITHTLHSATAHLQRFGNGTTYHATLEKLLEAARKRGEGDWTEQCRRMNSKAIWFISRRVGDIIQRQSRELSGTGRTGGSAPPGRT